ncbi:MAG: hypothetical protein LBS60_06790 [Deltaproteobacteria bacterium]|jgi:hypothetical protein|nr:hypothetical protein [Deltaproteobacteria bacterium]
MDKDDWRDNDAQDDQRRDKVEIALKEAERRSKDLIADLEKRVASLKSRVATEKAYLEFLSRTKKNHERLIH